MITEMGREEYIDYLTGLEIKVLVFLANKNIEVLVEKLVWWSKQSSKVEQLDMFEFLKVVQNGMLSEILKPSDYQVSEILVENSFSFFGLLWGLNSCFHGPCYIHMVL